MQKNEIGLQAFLILIVAGIFSLLALRFYPIYQKMVDLIPLPKIAIDLPRVTKVHAEVRFISPLGESIATPQNLPKQVEPKNAPTAIWFAPFDLTLEVAPGKIENNEWTLYEDKASWLTSSETPGQGNVIVYAHNRTGLFGDLDRLKIGDEIKLEYEGTTFVYTVAISRKVLPTDVEAIISHENQLTLYTCDGAFDQKRLVVIAKPQVTS